MFLLKFVKVIVLLFYCLIVLIAVILHIQLLFKTLLFIFINNLYFKLNYLFRINKINGVLINYYHFSLQIILAN